MKPLSLILAFLICLFPAIVFAEWFDGEVAGVDIETQELTLTENDPITEIEESEVIAIIPSTTFSGVKSLEDIKIGDEVSIAAQYDATSDSWQAFSVEVSGAGE